jgi:hypothetical protein
MTKKLLKSMLEERRFVTEAGKLTTEAGKGELETCAQPTDQINPNSNRSKKKAGGRNHLRVT